MSESVLPTVATTMSIGEPILNQLTHAWYCQNDAKLGSEVVSIAIVALPVELSVADAEVPVQSYVEDVVSRSFCQERVTFEELSDDDAVVKTGVHNTEQITDHRTGTGTVEWTFECAESLGIEFEN